MNNKLYYCTLIIEKEYQISIFFNNQISLCYLQMFQNKLQEVVKSLEVDYEKSQLTKNLMCMSDDLCLIWSHKDSQLVVVGQDTQVGHEAKIIPTDTPLFDVEHVSVNSTGRWICLWGSRGATALEIPRRAGKQRQFIGIDADGNVVTHTVPIAERFFLSNSKIVLQQVNLYRASHYSKSQIFVQKFNFDKTLQFFSGNKRCQQLKCANPQHFHEFFTQKFF